jgi:hypothetical protein
LFIEFLAQDTSGPRNRRVSGQFLDLGTDTTALKSFRKLRFAAGTLTSWRDPKHGTVDAVVSQPILMRRDDQVLLVGLIDVTHDHAQWLVCGRPHGSGLRRRH